MDFNRTKFLIRSLSIKFHKFLFNLLDPFETYVTASKNRIRDFFLLSYTKNNFNVYAPCVCVFTCPCQSLIENLLDLLLALMISESHSSRFIWSKSKYNFLSCRYEIVWQTASFSSNYTSIIEKRSHTCYWQKKI